MFSILDGRQVQGFWLFERCDQIIARGRSWNQYYQLITAVYTAAPDLRGMVQPSRNRDTLAEIFGGHNPALVGKVSKSRFIWRLSQMLISVIFTEPDLKIWNFCKILLILWKTQISIIKLFHKLYILNPSTDAGLLYANQ